MKRNMIQPATRLTGNQHLQQGFEGRIASYHKLASTLHDDKRPTSIWHLIGVRVLGLMVVTHRHEYRQVTVQ
jgi:hypothetical protein